MRYDAEMYSAVNTTLYRYFAVVGGFYQVGGIVAAVVLAFLVRRHPASARWTAAAVVLALSFVSWLILVAPVNDQVADALRAAPEQVPALWVRLRDRWEYGHAVGFVLQLAGFALLAWSVIAEVPAGRPRRGVT
jgi:hypothetical protein